MPIVLGSGGVVSDLLGIAVELPLKTLIAAVPILIDIVLMIFGLIAPIYWPLCMLALWHLRASRTYVMYRDECALLGVGALLALADRLIQLRAANANFQCLAPFEMLDEHILGAIGGMVVTSVSSAFLDRVSVIVFTTLMAVYNFIPWRALAI